jgi:hypothetical protein
MPKGFRGWAVWLGAQGAFTYIWQLAIKLAENAMLGWSDDQIAAWLGVTSPTLSTVITWTIPFILAAGTLWVFHSVTTRPLKEALARQSSGDQLTRTVTSQPSQTTGSPFPSPPPAATTVQWNQIFGTSRAADLVFALFLDGKGPDFKSIKLKDAFLESGITGEVIKMNVGSTNPLDNTFPISEASLIPPNGFIRLVAVMNPLSPNQGLPNKEFLDNWRKVWFNAVYEDEKPDRILFDEKVMGSYVPELSGPHVTRRSDVKKD